MPGALPAAPTGLASTVDRDQVTLTWNAAGGSGHYNIYRGDSANGEAWAPLATVYGNVLTYTDNNVQNYLHYYYKVAGTNATAVGPMSNEITASPGDHPFGQGSLAVSGSLTQAVLTWDAGFYANTFNVYRGTSPGGESATPFATGLASATYTDTTLVILLQGRRCEYVRNGITVD